MFCFVAFAVLAIMGIFSSTHRVLAKEAFSCIGRRVTFRPCDTGFQEKLQGQMVGFLMKHSVFAARILRRHFEILAWIFFILTIWSLWVSVVGVYNFYLYGSCSGLNQSSFCVLDPTGRNTAISDVKNVDDGVMPLPCTSTLEESGSVLSSKPLSLDVYPTISTDSNDKIVFIGCFECRYTRSVFSTIKAIQEDYNANLIFIHHPVFPKTSYLSGVTQCLYDASSGNEWWSIIEKFFSKDLDTLSNPEQVRIIIDDAGYDASSIMACAEESQTRNFVQTQRQEVVNTGLYGTPLIFVNGNAVVGPKPYRVYRFMLEEGKHWWMW